MGSMKGAGALIAALVPISMPPNRRRRVKWVIDSSGLDTRSNGSVVSRLRSGSLVGSAGGDRCVTVRPFRWRG